MAWGAPASAQEPFTTPGGRGRRAGRRGEVGRYKAILAVLGPDGQAIVSSGDPVADTNTRENFVAAYDAKHAIEPEGDGTQTLIIGDDDWPFPIPLVNKAGEWQFDTGAGLDEILRRRVGRNELSAIQVAARLCPGAERICRARSGRLGRGVYAQRIVSRPGKKDGLYWPTTEGQTPSPLGELAAQASAEGYKTGESRFPITATTTASSPARARAHRAAPTTISSKGKMRGGFALLAFPAEYGNSGIMTFMVNHDGTVFQKDLGPKTAKLARKIELFAPDGSLRLGRRSIARSDFRGNLQTGIVSGGIFGESK